MNKNDLLNYKKIQTIVAFLSESEIQSKLSEVKPETIFPSRVKSVIADIQFDFNFSAA